ncbi:MAG TPA: RNA polymerase subunit sigma [Peptococcaceae bacterium]|nr:RNA polymerase subunit sigma [Peptococcaceae bacterium]
MESSRIPVPLEDAAKAYFKHHDEDSLEQVIHSASSLIHYFANLYGKQCDREDLYQTGILGLMKALKNYESDKDVKFVTYASHCIIGEIRHLVRKQASYDRPGCIIELQHKVDHIIEEYIKSNESVPTTSYIAQQLHVKEESVDEVMRAGLVSFEELDIQKIHSTSYESFRLPIEDKLTLYQAISKLSGLQKKVIHMLFFQDMSQQQVADQIGMNQKKVSRIKEATIESIRKQMK